ncbi:hypothetical protein Bca4012_079019 [Brassica carinata]
MDDCPRRPVNKEAMIEVNLNVSALIQDGRQWDLTKLDNTFHVNEVQRIRQLPVGEVPDRDIWDYSSHGEYTVKSGYKIRSFLWLAASGALAVAERLNTQGMNLVTRCKLCMVGTESIEQVLGVGHCRVSLIIQLQQAGEEARVWHELNVVQQNMEVRNGLCDENKRWEPALAGYAKCNIHANRRNAKLHSGTALFIRDYNGNVLHHARVALTFSPNRLTAELRCLEWALRSMKDLAYQEIVVEPDFHEPIEAVMQSSEWPRFRVLLQRINALCASFASIFICDGVCCL